MEKVRRGRSFEKAVQHDYVPPTRDAEVRFRFEERLHPATPNGDVPDDDPEPTTAAMASIRTRQVRAKVRLPGKFGGLLVAVGGLVAILKFAPQTLTSNWVGSICITYLLVCGGLAVYLHRKG